MLLSYIIDVSVWWEVAWSHVSTYCDQMYNTVLLGGKYNGQLLYLFKCKVTDIYKSCLWLKYRPLMCIWYVIMLKLWIIVITCIGNCRKIPIKNSIFFIGIYKNKSWLNDLKIGPLTKTGLFMIKYEEETIIHTHLQSICDQEWI